MAPRPDRTVLLGHYPFSLDEFQIRALDALDDGESVLVAAPTGSGKTVVAEYGLASALADGRRAFYTTPIKALSNQKFQDLMRRHGTERVGLLTGDHSIRPDAPVVVMTTEVLRNMVYADSVALDDLGVVVLDEVHFIQDAYRGPVWEEVIIHLSLDVQLVCLSATVSNASEIAEWISTVRGPTRAVLEERRPVRLDHLYLVGDRSSERLQLMPTLVDGRPNPQAIRLDEAAAQRPRRSDPHQHRRRRPLYTPSRLDVVEVLDERDLLPAIVFVFSRNQCDEAAKSCFDAGLRFTSAADRARIRELIDARVADLEPRDLAVLGFARFSAQLDAGIAAHHAGMIPPFREIVEACFLEGLVKVVFATETLAVGINMPARTVVIEKLTKFTGEHHTLLTAGDYTQLTGRAGRRGLDDLGTAVVLWNPFVTFEQVATLAASRSFPLRSSFRPTYNMAANLVRSCTEERARELLTLSLAQFQADAEVVRIEARVARRRRQLGELRSAAQSPYGDIDAYRQATSRAERRRGASGGAEQVDAALAALRPGDVIHLEHGRYSGRAAVISVANRKGGTKIHALSPQRVRFTLSAEDFDAPPRRIGTIDLPTPFAPNRQSFQREVARATERAKVIGRGANDRDAAPRERDPIEDDPDLRDRLKAAAHGERVAREIDELTQRVERRGSSVLRQFHRVLDVLRGRGFVEGWSLIADGERLARTFHESDLLIAESLRAGLLDGLDPATLAGLASVFVYEHRSPEPPDAPWFPSRAVRHRFERIAAISRELQAEEEALGITPHRAPDPTFLAVAFAWAAGEGFAEVVAEEEMSGGDFIRTVRQLIDLLRQFESVGPTAALRGTAAAAREALHRGVVAASSVTATVEVSDQPAPVEVEFGVGEPGMPSS